MFFIGRVVHAPEYYSSSGYGCRAFFLILKFQWVLGKHVGISEEEFFQMD